MSYLMLIIAFIIMSCIGLFWCYLLQLNMGEGIFLAASSIILIMYGLGYFGMFNIALYFLILLASIGAIIAVWSFIKKKRIFPYGGRTAYGLLTLSLGAAIILFHGDFIQHIDEFHMWAAAIKYMLENNRLAIYSDFIGGSGHLIGTSMFHLFFQKFTRYNEGIMYISGLLLYMIGFLLPWGNAVRKQWKSSLLYSLIIYISIFSLYIYGNKNLYVDLPTASWASGITLWWVLHQKLPENATISGKHTANNVSARRSIGNGLILLLGLIVIVSIKFKFGILLDMTLLGFIIIHKLFIENQIQKNEKIKKRLIYIGIPLVVFIIIVAGVASIAIYHKFLTRDVPLTIKNQLDIIQFSRAKAEETFSTFLTILVGGPLAPSRSHMKISFFAVLVLSFGLLYIDGNIQQEQNRSIIYALYFLFASIIYLGILLLSYLCFMTYYESIRFSGGVRYLSIFAIYLFNFSVGLLLFECSNNSKGTKIYAYVGLGLLFFFSLGLNQKYVPLNTSFNKKEVRGYKDIHAATVQSKNLRKIINSNDRVYLLHQQGTRTNEFGTNTALYYMDNQLSNYLLTPWKFTNYGSVIRLNKTNQLTIKDFPQLLMDGHYTYVWVMTSNKYLKKSLPKVLHCSGGSIKDGNLYKVICINRFVVALDLVDNLK